MDIDTYKNILELFKQAMLFYSDKNNYIKTDNLISNIEKDDGFQARFALDKLNEIDNYLDDYDFFNSLGVEMDENLNQEEINEIIKKFNKYTNGTK